MKVPVSKDKVKDSFKGMKVRLRVKPEYSKMNWSLVGKRKQLDNIPKTYFKQVNRTIKQVNKNTLEAFEKMWEFNYRANREMFDMKSMNVKQLKHAHWGKPALLVGAGPSLNDNIETLKKKRRGRIIFAALHALPKLVKHGIRPDYVLLMDAQNKESVFLDGIDTRKLTMICGITADEMTLRKWKGKIYFWRSDDMVHTDCPIKRNMGSGGSVMGAAINLALNICGKKIIFVGMDMAMPMGSGGYIHHYHNVVDYNTGGDSFVTADITGRGVWTLFRMWMYKMWMESVALRTPGVEYINASEGGIIGAYPEGNLKCIKQMRLAEV